MISVIPVMVL